LPVPAIQPMIAGSVVLVSFRTTLFEQRVINTFQYYPIGTIDPDIEYTEYLSNLITNMQALAGLFDKWSACVPADITAAVIRAQIVYPVRLRYVEVPVTVTPGGGTANQSNVAISITRKSYVPGRHGLGRIQVPANSSDMALGKIDPGNPLYTNGVALADQMIDPIPDPATSITWQPIVWASGAVAPTQAVFQTQLQDTARVMRRRTLRVGE